MNNTSTQASDIRRNTIAKDLQCQNNSPPPTSSLPNKVGGNPGQDSEGQCKGF